MSTINHSAEEDRLTKAPTLRDIQKNNAVSATQQIEDNLVEKIPIDEFSRSLLETFRAKKTLASILIHETSPIEKLRLGHKDKKFVYNSKEYIKVMETGNMTNVMLRISDPGCIYDSFACGDYEFASETLVVGL